MAMQVMLVSISDTRIHLALAFGASAKSKISTLKAQLFIVSVCAFLLQYSPTLEACSFSCVTS